MSLVKWTDRYSVGVEEIDNQHKQLVSLLNDLFNAMRVGQANAVLGGIINQMIRYAQIHFATEEKYFDEFGFEFAADHKAEHQQFVEKVVDFKREFDKGNIVLSMKVFNFLKSWLNDHILNEDQKYRQCFHENGLRLFGFVSNPQFGNSELFENPIFFGRGQSFMNPLCVTAILVYSTKLLQADTKYRKHFLDSLFGLARQQ
jgi:hemerythrin